MAAYNDEAYIALAIASVRAQTRPDWELIVSDDGSSDRTKSIVRELMALDPRIQLLEAGKNRGPAQARNVAINEARGRYIAFLDSDDLWKPHKLERQLAFMEEQDVAFSFSSYDRLNEQGRIINTHLVSKSVTYADLLKTCVIGCLTAVYDSDKLGKMYMPDIRKRQDFGLWLRILKKVESAHPVPESLAQYRVRKVSVSSNKRVAAKFTWAVYRDVEGLGLMASSYYFANYALNGLVNTYIKPRLPR